MFKNMFKFELFAKLTVFMLLLAVASFGLAIFLDLNLFYLLARAFIVLAVVFFLIKVARALFEKELESKKESEAKEEESKEEKEQ